MTAVRVTTTLLVLLTMTAVAAEPKWTQREKVGSVRESNVMLDLVWKTRGGAQLRVEETDGERIVEVALNPRNPHVLVKSNAKDKGAILKLARFDLDALPTADSAAAAATLKVRTDMWTLYLEDRPVAQWRAPFAAPLTVWQPTEQIPTTGADDAVYVQKTGEFHFAADFMVEEGQENPLGDWDVVSGDWEIRTVMEEVMETAPTDRIKQRPLEAERSPNFSSLRGTGADAVILNGYDFYDNYRIEAAMLTDPGTVGLVFYYQGPRDYYSLTLTTADEAATEVHVELWRHSSKRLPRVVKLDEVMVPVTAHQWVKPSVKVWNEQLVCMLDGSEIFRVRDELPVGGRFGLIAKSDTAMRFDDVSVQTIRELNLTDTDRIAFHTVQSRGEFFQTSSFLGLFRKDLERRTDLPVPVTATDKWLLLGNYDDLPHVFAATFDIAGSGAVGLVLGYRDAGSDHLRMLYKLDQYSETFTLQRVKSGSTEDIETFRLPAPQGADRKPVRLMADATENGVLRIFRDGEMVFVHYPEDVPFTGASGIFVGANSQVTVSDMEHKSEREGIYRNQYEKNRNYVVDPFMRHWSSPEGQWFTDPNGLTWHKSDFFGRFDVAMPYVDGSVTHLGVPESRSIGSVSVKVEGDTLAIYETNGRELSESTPVVVGTIPADTMALATTEPATPQERMPAYTIHNEGYWVWVTCGREVVARHRLTRPLSGRRMRIEGFTTDHLASCVVDVYNIKDFLFNRAITDWTRNGGRWEVVNRFQCDPRWSHMNGEVADDIGALWAKYDFSGDFSVEMYVGMRHGWYNRAGDMNITVMNDANSPSRGYTLVTTGWDNNHSQNWSRLYRNGKEIQASDMYLVPRIRYGNERRYHDPLLNAGRPIHGAWYHIKLRRIGDTIEYWFDNQLVFRMQEDPKDRLDLGGMGIWTYMNSIMVARVKISAQHIEPKRITTSPVNPVDRFAADRLQPERFKRLLYGETPLQRVLPDYWSTHDPVGFTRLDWYEDHAERPYFVATNTLGSGRMFVDAALPPVPMSSIAGWAFQMKRMRDTQVNFHYEIGRMSGDTFTPIDRRYLQISGPSLRENGFKRTGQVSVPPVAEDADDWHKYDSWTSVRAWLPMDGYETVAADLYVRVVGFGLRQPSFEMQGLTGNAPGAAYAVAGFTPILFAPPKIARNPEHSELIPQSFMLMWPGGGRPPARSVGLLPLADVLVADARAGFNHRIVRAVFRGQVADADACWMALPETPTWTVKWDPAHEGAILITSPQQQVDRRLYQATVTARGTALQVEAVDEVTRRAYLPLTIDWLGAAATPLEITVGEQVVTLDWTKRKPEQPVLVGIDGYSPLLETFESAAFGSHVAVQPLRMAIERYEPDQGAYLHVWNQVANQRLATLVPAPFNLAQYPLLRFRYRAEDMANVSIRHGQSTIAFSEERAGAPTVRYAPEKVLLDETWHTWTGMISDVNAGDSYQTRRFYPGSLQIASVANPDQTGAHSAMGLDDLVFGPAVSKAEQLVFTPQYMDFGGLRAVQVATHAGDRGWEDLSTAERAKVQWQDSVPGEPVQPSIQGLEQGLHYIFVRATDSDGRASRVTSLPFLYDSRPLQVAHNFETRKENWTNGSVLRLSLNAAGGAPVDLESLTFTWDGKPLRPHASYNRFIHAGDASTVTLNWPYELQAKLNTMADGESADLLISGLVDGAGNPSPDVTVPIKIDFAADKTGPTLLGPRLPDNVELHTNWYGHVNLSTQFAPLKNNGMSVVAKWGEEPYVVNTSYQAHGGAILNARKWRLANQPYFAFRMLRPAVPETDKLVLQLDVTLADDKTHSIVLTPARPKEKRATLTPPITWTEKTWQTVNVNVAAELADVLKGKDGKDTAVKSITIRRVSTTHQEPLWLMAACAYGPWTADDKVVLRAFDASGTVSMAWEYVDGDGKTHKTGTLDGTTIAPASLGLPAVRDGWLLLYAVDRAGNRSLPLRLPITP